MRRALSTGFVLAGIDFFDELASGLPAAGAPELRADLEATVTGITVAVFTLPLLVSLFVDTPVLFWAERRGRSRMIALGLFGMGAALILAGCAGTVPAFGAAFALFAVSSGLACSLAQAALMDGDPARREQNMTAWAFSGTLGDLCAPLCIAAAVALAGSHRAAYFAVGVGLVCLSPWFARRELPSGAPLPEDDDEPARGALRSALSNRALLLWLAGVSLCGLLDEIFAAFGALWLRERFPRDPAVVATALTACTLGALIGLALLHRLLARHSPQLLLAIACTGSIVAHFGWLASRSSLAATLWMGVAGLFVAWHYPLAQAQAYRAA
ncbi:MAG TPA: MFS transporter, partial [Polyangiaceae bacterium]